MEEKEMGNLFKETADAHTPSGFAAFTEFCAAIETPILQEVRLQSVVRGLFAEERLGPQAQAVYPIADDFEVPVWVLPGMGRVPQNMIEGVGEDVYVPTFSLTSAADWKVQYARDSRVDIALQAAKRVARELARYEEESGWRVIVEAGTSAFSGKGLLRPRPAPIYEVDGAATGAGFISKELLNLMIVGMRRTGRTLTDIWVSPEDMADLREWSDTEVDFLTRREIFQVGGMGKVWNVNIHEIEHLGPRGLFNINGSTSEYGLFLADGSDNYNDYHLDNPNVVDANGVISTEGETQIWGFDMTTNNSLVMPIKKDYEAIPDPNLLRSQKQGFFGWEEVGFANLDSRMECMAVIDRTI